MKKFLPVLLMAFLPGLMPIAARDITLMSPNARFSVTLHVGDQITYSLTHGETNFLQGLPISLGLADGRTLGLNAGIEKVSQSEHDQWVIPEIREKNEKIHDRYRQVSIDFKGGYSLDFRLFDAGLAYRFRLNEKDSVTVVAESGGFTPHSNARIWFPEEKNFNSSHETPYLDLTTDSLEAGRMCYTPTLIKPATGPLVWIGEADVWDYPGLWLTKNQEGGFDYTFPAFPAQTRQSGSYYGRGYVETRASYIARIHGKRSLPWRLIAWADEDTDLIKNQLVYLLSSPCRLDDVSWIKPGWVILDWWARRNIFGVDFKSGINTETARYFIDFCANYNIQYFLLDDGWVDNGNLLAVNKDLDMPAVLDYARSKGVSVMVWLMWSTLDQQMTEALDLYQQWGVEGVKVDFMNRDDQQMMRFYERVAAETAKRHMVVDFHGSFKPNGLRRAYPNILTREGLIELEQNGWIDWANPDHHCTLPFIRNVAGPMDYIPGSMQNATKENFRPVGNRPMEQGTRAHAMALAVICESPMQMVPDAPGDYYANDACSRFLFSIPVTWDQTIPLAGEVADYLMLVRRHGEDWYLSAITDWTPRDLKVDLSFLPQGDFEMQFFEDGVNADTRAIDYRQGTSVIDANSHLDIKLAPGGGFVARISPKEL